MKWMLKRKIVQVFHAIQKIWVQSHTLVCELFHCWCSEKFFDIWDYTPRETGHKLKSTLPGENTPLIADNNLEVSSLKAVHIWNGERK